MICALIFVDESTFQSINTKVLKYQFDTLGLYFRRTHSCGIKGKIKKYPPVSMVIFRMESPHSVGIFMLI